MGNKKERKQEIVTEVREYKNALKKRKDEIATLSAEEQVAAKSEDKAATKQSKINRKQEIQGMSKDERRIARKHDKVFRKVKNRPRRAVIWSVVALLLVFGVAKLIPIVSSISGLFAITLDSKTPAGEEARANSAVVSKQIADEGIVLLENEDNLLPLTDNKMNVFSVASFNIKYSGSGSGASNTADAVDLYTALDEVGISYNKDLYDMYVEQGANDGNEPSTGIMQIASLLMGGNEEDEPDISYLSDDIISNAKNYSENAMVFLSSSATETTDLTAEALSPSDNSMALLETVCANFDNVIVVINAGNALQLGFLEEYPSIKAAVWIGTPGPYGCQSLAEVLTGEINPSGRLVDTYAYDANSAPSTVNLGDYQFDNIENMAFLNYEEGIYVGYRFYETYFKDDENAYWQTVQYPFGYGLSYTEFSWEIDDNNFNADTMQLKVKVTNTGDAVGKEVVQAYFKPPYTAGGIEKSVIELAGYAKTKLLQPGESEIVTIEFATRDMSSYDINQGAYVLEEGNYDILISRNVHEMVDSLSYSVNSTVVYDTDDTTGTEITNHFDYAEGDLTYLSRNDWTNTYPDESNRSYSASDEVVSMFAETPAKVEGEVPTMGAENNIQLADLQGLDYDDPMWDLFLDQFTYEEMRELFVDGAYKTVPIERLGVPQTVLLDGPAGLNSFFSEVVAAAYPTEVVIASTWNDKMAYLIGDAVGTEAVAYGVTGWYAPGMNIHRTSMGGRNFEYYSEDPLLSGKMAAAMVNGAQSHDILVFIKHFALNEQEINARKGVSVWLNEQALREIYLRPFEIAVKESQPTAAMSSFIYVGPKWAGGNPELLQDVLREEWGFDGLVSTDAVLGSFMDANLALRYGNELMLAPLPTGNRTYVDKLYKEDPVGVASGLRDRTHTTCYVIVNDTYLFE